MYAHLHDYLDIYQGEERLRVAKDGKQSCDRLTARCTIVGYAEVFWNLIGCRGGVTCAAIRLGNGLEMSCK